MKLSRFAGAVFAASLLAPCAALAKGEIDVVATFSVIGDMAAEVGGERVDLSVLTGRGGDAHIYQPTPGDVKRVAGADIVLVNGLGFEGWLDRLIKASGTKAPVIMLSKGVRPLANEEDEDEHEGHEDHAHDDHEGHGHDGHAHEGHDHGEWDPHAWQDVGNAKIYVAAIRDAFVAKDPKGRDYYEKRAEAYLQRLSALDDWIKEQIARVPEGKRKIITSHDAFAYFSHAYGVTFLAPLGKSTDAEASPAAISALLTQIKTEGVKAVFIENITDPRLIETLSKDAGVSVSGVVYADSLSLAGGEADSYEKMMRHNVTLFVEAMLKN